jgi:hypothetical protein
MRWGAAVAIAAVPWFYLWNIEIFRRQVMNTNSGPAVSTLAITANLAVLHSILANAAERSAEAHELILRGERNGAIGAISGLDSILDDAKALYAAAMALHRMPGS